MSRPNVSRPAPSLRGGGDVLSCRLADVRANILANGVPRWHVEALGRTIVLDDVRAIPVAFRYFRRKGASVVHVYETRFLLGVGRVHVDKGVDWLLLSDPVLLPLQRYERSESAERLNGKDVK